MLDKYKIFVSISDTLVFMINFYGKCIYSIYYKIYIYKLIIILNIQRYTYIILNLTFGNCNQIKSYFKWGPYSIYYPTKFAYIQDTIGYQSYSCRYLNIKYVILLKYNIKSLLKTCVNYVYILYIHNYN